MNHLHSEASPYLLQHAARLDDQLTAAVTADLLCLQGPQLYAAGQSTGFGSLRTPGRLARGQAGPFVLGVLY